MLGLLTSAAFGQNVARVATVPTHAIGLDEDSLYFDRIAGIAALPHGELVVAELRSAQVRLVDPERRTSLLLGRPGGGPGEFRSPAEVGLLPGRIWVYDLAAMRMTVFADSGGVVETFRTVPLTSNASLLAGGVIAGTRRLPGDPEQAGRWLVLFDAKTEVARDSIPLQNPWREFTLKAGPLDITSLQLWSDHTLWEPSVDGSGLLVVDRPTTGPPVITVSWYDPAGGLRAQVEVDYEPVRISPDYVRTIAEAYSEAMLDPNRSFSRSIDRRALSPSAIEEKMYVPDRLPPVSAITVGSGGRVYLRRPAAAADARVVEYWILDRSGIQAAAGLPADFRPMCGDPSGLWGVRKDELGREYIVHYRFEPASAN